MHNLDYDYILVCDTEGLISPEKKDNEFERKILLFILAVSNIVLINIKGDLHKPIVDLLEITSLSLHELKKSTIPHSEIFFIFNQNPDPKKEVFL